MRFAAFRVDKDPEKMKTRKLPSPLAPRSLSQQRGSYPPKNSPRRQPCCITAAVAPLTLGPLKPNTSEELSEFGLPSSSRRCSAYESVMRHPRCQRSHTLFFHGLCSPSRFHFRLDPPPRWGASPS